MGFRHDAWRRASAPSATQAATQGATQKISIVPNAQNLDVATAVAKKVVPSVVSVTIQQPVTDFSGNQSYRKVGTGSGVIIRADGYILTNNHVVEGAERVIVTVGLEDKVATVVGTDPSTDLAVLKIEGSGYPAVEAGSSKALQVGQFVMAVGSPFGLEKTVTSGIVSALQRSEQAQGQTANDITTYTNLIQTDAAINPGNSGGALVDGQGKLVGINSLIQSPSGGVGAAQSAGIGFAIPVDFAIDIANQLIETRQGDPLLRRYLDRDGRREPRRPVRPAHEERCARAVRLAWRACRGRRHQARRRHRQDRRRARHERRGRVRGDSRAQGRRHRGLRGGSQRPVDGRSNVTLGSDSAAQ